MKSDSRNYYIPFVLIGLFYLPLIINNSLYVDDAFRAQNGFDGWSASGRPFADIIMHGAMMSGGPLINYGQLGQVASVVIMALTAIYFCRRVLLNTNPVNLIASCGFAISPFYLENISYQYDSLPMTLSLCLSMVAAIQAGRHSKSGIVISSVLVASCCALYQTSINTFIGFSAVVIMLQALGKSGKDYDALKSAGACVLSLIVGLILYAFMIKLIFPMTGSRGGDIHIDATLIGFLVVRIKRFYSVAIGSISLYLGMMMFLISVLVALCLAIKNKVGLVNALLSVICGVAIFLCPIGFLFIFKETSVAPRMMMGASVISCLVFVMLSFIGEYKITRLCLIPLALMPFFVNSYSFSSAIKEQRYFDRSLVEMSVSDARRDDGFNKSFIVFSGRSQVAPNAIKTASQMPVIGLMLIPAYDWTASMMAQSMAISDVRFVFARTEQKKISAEVCESKISPVSETAAYAVYRSHSSNGYLVWMKGGNGSPCQ